MRHFTTNDIYKEIVCPDRPAEAFGHELFQTVQANSKFEENKNISRIKKTTFPHSLLILAFKIVVQGCCFFYL